MQRLLSLVLVAAAGCTSTIDSTSTAGSGSSTPDPTDPGGSGSSTDPGSGSASSDAWQTKLNGRVYNYPAALKTAALRLTGELPTVDQIRAIAAAANPKQAYEAQITAWLADPRFARQALGFWRDTFKMGGAADLDAAPAFATQLTTSNASADQLFTATTGTCPTVTTTAAGIPTVTAANCTNGAPITAGVLTNPGAMKQYTSNMAFRRVRWVQEVFDCTAFPAEVQAPTPVGSNNAPYTAPWPFQSISSPSNGGGRIDFLDTSAVVCANCHETMNHIAPLFAHFDATGKYTANIAVLTPLAGNPVATATDWLPAGQTTAWRMGTATPDLGAFGAALAADPKVAECFVARAWNFALGKADIVQTLSVVPSDVIATQTAAFTANGRKLRDLFFAVFTSDDFTKY